MDFWSPLMTEPVKEPLMLNFFTLCKVPLLKGGAFGEPFLLEDLSAGEEIQPNLRAQQKS